MVTVEQISHEGILDDQGGPVEFFTSRGVGKEEILDDQLMVYEEVEHEGKGPRVVTGPVAVEGAQPGDWLELRCMEIEPRVAYGVAFIRDGAGPFPDEYPRNGGESYSSVVRFDMARP